MIALYILGGWALASIVFAAGFSALHRRGAIRFEVREPRR